MKTTAFFCLLVVLSILMGDYVMGQVDNQKIAMIIARENFRDEELLVPKDLFTKAGYQIVIFSSSLGKATGMLGAEVDIDKTIAQLNLKEFKAIIFVGGSGASQYWNDKKAQQIARQAIAEDKVLGAICIAPVTLARAGVLKGKEATVWSSEKQQLVENGAVYKDDPVVIAGRIVTANGPQSAANFAQAIMSLI